MRIQDIIRSMIDLIDGVKQPEVVHHEPKPVVIIKAPELDGQASPLTHAGDDINRFRQIVDLHSEPKACGEFANSPDEKYADIEAVTTHAGGGVNGPKHPHDIRVKDPSAYPNQQEC